MLALYILACVFLYTFIGGLSGAKHHQITRKEHNHGKGYCFEGTWCNHALVSVWGAGVFWIFALPVFAGTKIGSFSREDYLENKRTREVEAAQHKIRLAKLEAERVRSLEKELGIAQ